MKRLKYNLVYRFTIIVGMAIKFIWKIYFFHFRHSVWDYKTKEKWNHMLRKMGQEYREKAEKLGGLLVKVGQFLSTRTDFLPDVFIREITGLVDRVPPMPFAYAKGVLEEEWKTDISAHLQHIGEKPIASASIGEVYEGILKDGSKVAIKVRRFRIDEVFHRDFIALRMVFWILKVFTSFGKRSDLNALYKEIVFVMDRELDFEQELAFGKFFHEKYKDNPNIHIPYYYEQLSTSKVIVMEWIDGEKITDTAFMKKHGISIEETSKIIFDFYLEQFLTAGKFHADPHAGNIFIEKNGRVGIIDFGMIGEISHADIEQFKLLVQGFLIDNYDIVVDALDKMNFILPHADRKKLKKMIEETIDMYSDGSLKNLDTQALGLIQEEVNTIVKDQAIQLPADYAYLLRAISIVVGLLYEINPDIDIVQWMKPKIKDWFGRASIAESIAKQYAKNAAEPLLSYPRAFLTYLQSGEKNRQWDQEKHYQRMKHQYYLLLEFLSFMMALGGVFLSVYGHHMESKLFFYIGLSLFILFFVNLIAVLFIHYRFIRKQKIRRDHYE